MSHDARGVGVHRLVRLEDQLCTLRRLSYLRQTSPGGSRELTKEALIQIHEMLDRGWIIVEPMKIVGDSWTGTFVKPNSVFTNPESDNKKGS